MVADNAPDNPAPDTAKGETRFAASAAAQRVISQFGGIRPLANKLGIAVSTVQGWRERGAIPAGRRAAILAAAKAHEVELDEAALDAASGGAAETEAEAAPPVDATQPAATTIPKSGTAKLDAGDKPARRPSEARAGSGSVGAWLGGFVLGVVVLALGAGGAVLTRDLWSPPAESEPAATTDAGELQVFERRIAALESALASSAGASGDAESAQLLRQEIAALSTKLDGMGGRLDAVESASRPDDALDQRLGVIEEQVAALAASAGVGEEMAALEAGSRPWPTWSRGSRPWPIWNRGSRRWPNRPPWRAAWPPGKRPSCSRCFSFATPCAAPGPSRRSFPCCKIWPRGGMTPRWPI